MLKLVFWLGLVARSLCLTVAADEIFEPKPLVPLLDGRIVGGWPVEIASHPHQVSFQNWHRHSCGGSLISPEWILTAAHCISAGTHRYQFRLGSELWAQGGVLVSSSVAIRHPLYNSSTLDYDIGLMKLAQLQSEVADAIGYAQLPPEGWAPLPGATASVTGWGTPFSGGSLMDELQEVFVPIVSNDSCEEYYREWLATRSYQITERMLCAGFVDGGKDACQGDSGGPLIVDGYLTGVVSWGNGCAFAGYPGLYASVPNLRAWIREETGL
ncbi:hypothetical protein YQE_12831, partial [Dendroctonus ponderosae]